MRPALGMIVRCRRLVSRPGCPRPVDLPRCRAGRFGQRDMRHTARTYDGAAASESPPCRVAEFAYKDSRAAALRAAATLRRTPPRSRAPALRERRRGGGTRSAAKPVEGQQTMPDSNEPAVRYFALIDDERGYPDSSRARRITGLVRRTATRPVPTDEALGRDFKWGPTEYLRRYKPGTDEPHEEISAESAERLIESWRATTASREAERAERACPESNPPIDDAQT